MRSKRAGWLQSKIQRTNPLKKLDWNVTDEPDLSLSLALFGPWANCPRFPPPPSAALSQVEPKQYCKTVRLVLIYSAFRHIVIIIAMYSDSTNADWYYHICYFLASAIDCGAPSFPSGVTVEPFSRTTVGSEIAYQCQSGFLPEEGRRTSVCGGDGRWNPDPQSLCTGKY